MQAFEELTSEKTINSHKQKMQFCQKQNCILDLKSDYNFFFPVAFTLAQRAFANFERFALAAALIFLRAFFTGLALTDGFAALILAHRNF